MKWALALLVLMALAAGGLTWASYAHTARVEAAHPPIGAFIDVGGERVHYLERGAGPPVILIHGANGNLRDWTHRGLIDRLAQDHRVIAMDRPGAGYTTRNGADLGDPRNQAAVLRRAAEALGVSAPIVVGHSWGGAVALAWGMQDPGLSGVVALAPVASDPPGAPDGLYRLLAAPGLGAVVAALAPLVFSAEYVEGRIGGVFAPDPPQDGYGAALAVALSLRYAQARNTARDIVTLYDGAMAEMAAGYGALRPPLEIITGDRDGSVSHEIHALPLSRAAPDARLTVIPEGGHMPHHVHPGILVEAIARLNR